MAALPTQGEPTAAHTPRAFVLANTRPARAPLVPELTLHLASELVPLWQATEARLAEQRLAPPFWAFAWPGAQALARHLLDHPDLAHGRRVLDFAAGCGLAALAAARAGAAAVDAADIDPLAAEAMALNARANGLAITPLAADLTGTPCRWDLILAGDVCYEAPMTARILPWLRACARTALVLLADPGRAYLPATGLDPVAVYDVPTTLELEDRPLRRCTLYRLLPAA